MFSFIFIRLAFLATASLAVTTTTVINPAVSSTPTSPSVPTATDFTNNVTFSAINKHITFPDLPDHVNLTCVNCSTSGTIEFASGGYNPNDTALHVAMDFFEDGFLKFVAHNLTAVLNTTIALTPGFSVANLRVPLYDQHLFTLPLGPLGSIDIHVEIFMPITLQLDSEITISPSLTLSVPDNSTLYLSLDNSTSSHITGFNETTLTPSFNLTDPSLSFSLLTGIDYLISANATLSPDIAGSGAGDAGPAFSGHLAASLGLPILNTTVTRLAHVNTSCDAPVPGSAAVVLDEAVAVRYEANVGLDLSGGVGVSVANYSKEWAPPVIEAFNRTVALPTECFGVGGRQGGLVPAAEAGRAMASESAAAGAGGSGSGSGSGNGVQGGNGKTSAASAASGRGARASLVGLVVFVLALVVM